MRRVLLKNVQYNMKLARTIYSDEGGILLSKGVTLKKEYIKRLDALGISDIYIQDEFSHDIEVNDVIHEQIRNETKLLIKQIMHNYKVGIELNASSVKKVVNTILDELLGTKDILVNLIDIKTVDDYTFAHSVNVCVLSIITGINIGLNQLKLRDLGVGALLHDVGKTLIPQEILKKPSKLDNDEFEQIKKHTILGYELLKKNANISSTSAYIALAHHERFNGSGYPLSIAGEKIHLFARIVAIADVYDALTSDRVYRKKVSVHEVIEYINGLGTQHFDSVVVEYFIQNIASYPVGTGVLLSNGYKGIVVEVSRNLPKRPIIRIVYDQEDNKVEKHEIIDLKKVLNITIKDTCEI